MRIAAGRRSIMALNTRRDSSYAGSPAPQHAALHQRRESFAQPLMRCCPRVRHLPVRLSESIPARPVPSAQTRGDAIEERPLLPWVPNAIMLGRIVTLRDGKGPLAE